MKVLKELMEKTILVFDQLKKAEKPLNQDSMKYDMMMVDDQGYRSVHHSSNEKLIREYCDFN